eukprot:2087277-Rhodomonas_salina.4
MPLSGAGNAPFILSDMAFMVARLALWRIGAVVQVAVTALTVLVLGHAISLMRALTRTCMWSGAASIECYPAVDLDTSKATMTVRVKSRRVLRGRYAMSSTDVGYAAARSMNRTRGSRCHPR